MARSNFKFRLQRLLEIREMREKQEQQKLIALRIVLAQEEQVLVRLEAEEQALIERMTIPRGARFDIEDRLACERYLVVKRKEQTTQKSKIRTAAANVEAQVAVVRQAGIDVKALEKLREKQLEEHRLEQLAEEAIFLDDLSGQQYIRQQVAAAEEAEDDAAWARAQAGEAEAR